MRIGVLGSGEVGRTLTAGFAAAGHEVTLGSRTPDAPELAEWATISKVATAKPTEAIKNADVIVNATPGAASVAVLTAAEASELDGKVLLDVSNPLDFSTGTPACPRHQRTASGSNYNESSQHYK